MSNYRKILRIRTSDIIWFLFFFVITGFDSIRFIAPTVYRIRQYGSLLCAFWLAIHISRTRKIKLNIITIEGVTFLIIPLITTAIFNRDLSNFKSAIIQFYFCAMMLLGCDCMFREIGMKRAIMILLSIFEVLLYVNFIAMLLYPNGMLRFAVVNNLETWIPLTRNSSRIGGWTRVAWMLDHQGLLTIYVIPGSCLSLLWASMNRKKFWNFRTMLLIVVSCIQVFYFARSANCILAYTIFFLILIIVPLWLKLGLSLPDIKWLFLCISIVFLGVVFFNIQENFEWLLVNILHRDLTMTGRLTVWINAIYAILRKPILGWGYIDSVDAVKLFVAARHPHNQFLHIAYQGGLVALGIFIAFLLSSFKALWTCRKVKNMQMLVIWAANLSILIGMFGDRYIPYYGISFVVFILAAHTAEIINIS